MGYCYEAWQRILSPLRLPFRHIGACPPSLTIICWSKTNFVSQASVPELRLPNFVNVQQRSLTAFNNDATSDGVKTRS
jgi:hypothetical protein